MSKANEIIQKLAYGGSYGMKKKPANKKPMKEPVKKASILKEANKEEVMKNLEAGHSPMKAVQAAYPDWSEKLVKVYVEEMGLEKSAEDMMGNKKKDFGMLSVKAGIDNNPKPTQADKIVGAKMNKKASAFTFWALMND